MDLKLRKDFKLAGRAEPVWTKIVGHINGSFLMKFLMNFLTNFGNIFWQYFFGIFWKYVLTGNIEFVSWRYVLKVFFEFWQCYLMIFKSVLTERALDKSTLELVDLKAKVFHSRTFGCNWNVKNGVLVDPWSPHFLPCFLYWNWQDL